jgi:hypothetical protein
MSHERIELAFLSYPFMRLVGTFNSILEIVAFEWQKLCYRVGAVRYAGAERRHVVHCLSDFEFMAAHNILDFRMGPRH